MFAYKTVQPALDLLTSKLFSLHLIDWFFVVFENKCSETVSAADVPDCRCKTSGFMCYKRFERPWAESWYSPMAPTAADLSTVIMVEQLCWRSLGFSFALPEPGRKGSCADTPSAALTAAHRPREPSEHNVCQLRRAFWRNRLLVK